MLGCELVHVLKTPAAQSDGARVLWEEGVGSCAGVGRACELNSPIRTTPSFRSSLARPIHPQAEDTLTDVV